MMMEVHCPPTTTSDSGISEKVHEQRPESPESIPEAVSTSSSEQSDAFCAPNSSSNMTSTTATSSAFESDSSGSSTIGMSNSSNSARTTPTETIRFHHTGGRSGEISPSTICKQRKLSAAVVTDHSYTNHEYVAGRPTIPVDVSMPMPSLPKRSLFSSMSSMSICSSTSFIPRPEKTQAQQRKQKQQQQQKQKQQQHQQQQVEQQKQLDQQHQYHQQQVGGTSASSASLSSSLVSSDDAGSLRQEAWGEAIASEFLVRGPSYLRDRKKVRSQPSVFQLLTVDLVQAEAPDFDGMCNHPNERIQQALGREIETGIKQLPDFVFAVNLVVPGPPVYHMVIYFGIDDDVSVLTDQNTPLGRLASKFFFGDSDSFRDLTFKLIPRIIEGNFVVKKAVGSKPSLVGRKLKQYYIRDQLNPLQPRFFELILDIGSDAVAQKIVQLTVGYARSLIVDMMFVLEGTDEATLPEQILGGVRLNRIDLKNRDGQRRLETC